MIKFDPELKAGDLFTTRHGERPQPVRKVKVKAPEAKESDARQRIQEGQLLPISYQRLIDDYSIKIVSTKVGQHAIYEPMRTWQKLTRLQEMMGKRDIHVQPDNLREFYRISEGQVEVVAFRYEFGRLSNQPEFDHIYDIEER